MLNAEETTKKFMEDLEAGKFKRQTVPNQPPYSDGEVELPAGYCKKFLESDLGKAIIELE